MNSTKVKFMVDGMHCPNCVKKIKAALEEMNGVEEALVDRENGIVEVSCQREASLLDGIRDKINTIHGGKFFATLVE